MVIYIYISINYTHACKHATPMPPQPANHKATISRGPRGNLKNTCGLASTVNTYMQRSDYMEGPSNSCYDWPTCVSEIKPVVQMQQQCNCSMNAIRATEHINVCRAPAIDAHADNEATAQYRGQPKTHEPTSDPERPSQSMFLYFSVLSNRRF